MVRIMTGPWCDVMLQKLSADHICGNIILSMVVCGICFAEPDMTLVCKNLLWSIRRRNPPCNVEDNLRAGLVVIEAWFRGY